jgi:hypothetical protein
MGSYPNSSRGDKPPRSARRAALAAGAEIFGYHVGEVIGDAVTFLACESCGSAPAVLRVLPGDRWVDSFLDLVVWCGPCARDTHHVVVITPSPSGRR